MAINIELNADDLIRRANEWNTVTHSAREVTLPYCVFPNRDIINKAREIHNAVAIARTAIQRIHEAAGALADVLEEQDHGGLFDRVSKNLREQDAEEILLALEWLAGKE